VRLRRFLVLILAIFCISSIARAQDYGQEWIDFNKNYFKVSLAQDGIYRITYTDLINAGFPVASVDPRRLQIFHRGEEQAISVIGQGDAVFNTSDYIEFYGQRNDGTLDAALYEPQSAQPHNFYNIYSDSSAYFLTYNLTPINGKRIQSFLENNVGGLPAESSHTNDLLVLNTANYSSGRSFNSGDVTRFTFFDEGEGWTSPLFQEGEFLDTSITGIDNTVTIDGNPQLEVLLVGRDDVTHFAEVFVGPNVAALRSLGTVSFTDYESFIFNAPVTYSDLSASGELLVRVEALGDNGGNDRISVSYVRLEYPEGFDAQSENLKIFKLNQNPGNKSYLEINNVPGAPRLYDITDPDNIIRIGINQIGADINAIVNNTSLSREILLFSENALLTPVIKNISFREIDATAHDYIIISNKILRQSAGGIADPINEYATYRASNDGGSFDTLTVDMDLLYNQFHYGETSAQAIKNFMRFMVDQGDPMYLLLIGKGLDPRFNFHRNSSGFVNVTKLGITYQIRDLVPSAGNPGSDIEFTAGLGSTTYEPAVPVGRLPASNSSQVLAYLNKVKEMASLPFDELWRKDVLQLSGGISAFELSRFRDFMQGFENIAEDNFFGGKITQINKQSNSTVELINVSDEINKGVNLVTFFGHSSPSVIDIDIGFVTDPVLGYNNQGKYPSFLINGCNAGQFFNQNILFGEDWINAADRGALGFIAHASFGFSNSLRNYTDTFYEVAYGDSLFINKSIGEVHKETARRYMEDNSDTPLNITQAQQMVLLGDPAINIFGAEQPDFEINADNISAESFTNEPISAESDSFLLKMVARNFGITTKDSLKVNIRRTLTDNTSIAYDTIFRSVKYADTLLFLVPNAISNSAGNNQFTITLDPLDSISELNEVNNTAIFNIFIPLFGTKNLYPINYSIENQRDVQLLAQATDPFSSTRNFLFELDTVSSFDSPFRKQTSVSARILASWSPEILPEVTANDSTVYFWRTKFSQPAPGESDEWVVSSFIYINNGPEGWSQSVFDQYSENTLLGLTRNETSKELEFERTSTDVSITTFGSANPSTIADISVQLNGTEYNINNLKRCRDNTINLIAFDKNTSVPYAGIPFIFQDPKTCGRTPQVINSFRLNEMETGGDDLLEYIDQVSESDSVVIYSIGNPQYSLWSNTLKSKMEELGLSSAGISLLQDGEPWIVFARKGAPVGTAEEYLSSTSPETEQELSISRSVSGIFSDGSMTSTIIGPSSNWELIRTRTEPLESNDTFSYDIIGINTEGEESELFTNINSSLFDISSVNTVQYPYLKLRVEVSDDVNLTAPQLDKWQVIYEGVPEGIFLLNEEFEMNKNAQEGEQLDLSFNFLNISDRSFSDSLSVNYTTFNQSNQTSEQLSKNILAPTPSDTTSFNISLSTRGKSGLNSLNVFVNPRVEPEQYYDNNILDISDYLNVEADEINPILDVVFDGQRILDGDIVSPSPVISIILKEENQFLLKSDTTGINIFIKQECETCVFQRITFSQPNVQWFPATQEEEFRVEYQPEPLEDGIYTLRVEASDETGNQSGMEPYTIRFEVINETTITNFYPYPNPFSTSTRFIFTLTGSVIPDEIKIQIMTVSGRIVREITQNELGPINIGNNVTDFAWNGRDEFGDQLANGVYIYRVLVNSNGESVKGRSTSADRAFKKGYGKLYLLR